MNFAPILCLLFLAVARSQFLEEESENGIGPNGIKSSFLDSINPGHNGDPIMGRFVYTTEDGQLFEVFYFADVYGYQAQGRLIEESHPLANSIKRWNMKITMDGN